MVGQNGKGDYGQVYRWAEKARKESNRRDERENVAMERYRGGGGGGWGGGKQTNNKETKVSTF